MKKRMLSILIGMTLLLGCAACGTASGEQEQTGSGTSAETTDQSSKQEDNTNTEKEATADSEAASESAFEYHVMSDGTAEIIDYDGDSTEIIIPSEIDGYTVTAIGLVDEEWDNEVTGGFIQTNTSVEKVVIPDTVKIIGGYSFFGCENLKEVVIGTGVEEIHTCAFQSAGIESIVLPEGVISIDSGAFATCTNLVSVQLPSSLTTIEAGNFRACADDITITAPAGSAAETYATDNGIAFVTE